MGATGNSGARNSRTVENSEVLQRAQDYVSHRLGTNEYSAKVISAEVVSEIDRDGIADVKVEYEVGVRIPIGIDPETGRMEIETDTEYRTGTFAMKVRNIKDMRSQSPKPQVEDLSKVSASQLIKRYNSMELGRDEEKRVSDELENRGYSYSDGKWKKTGAKKKTIWSM